MKALNLRKLSRNELPLWNTIFRVNNDLGFDLGGKGFRFVFSPLELDYRPELSVRMSCQGQTLWVCLEISESFLEEQVSRDFEGLRIHGLPMEVRLAVFEATFEELIGRFESWVGDRIAMEEILHGQSMPNGARKLAFRIASDKPHAGVRGCLHFPDDKSFEWFSRLLTRIPPTIPRACLFIPLECALEVGRTRLRVCDLRGLDRFDLIRIDEYYPSQDKRLVLHFHPDVRFWAVMEGKRVSVVERKEREEVAEGNVAKGFDDIEIELRFEIGEKQIVLKDLSNLKAGYTFDLETVAERAVTIKANGKRIGYGELVEIDGHVGVRVLEVFQDAEQPA